MLILINIHTKQIEERQVIHGSIIMGIVIIWGLY